MATNAQGRADRPSRVLLFSHRNIYRQEVWRCSFREFENLLQKIDAVDMVAPTPTDWYTTGRRAALRLGEYVRRPVNPGISPTPVEKDYDLLFTIIERPADLLSLMALKDWKNRCTTSICWLIEFYVTDIPIYKSCMEMLSQFDHVIFMFAADEPFKAHLKGETGYLPAGVDALRFCPFPVPPPRSIEVYSLGRRSETTHQALLRMAEEEGKFYLYDTLRDLLGHDLEQHRALVANTAKRSRYFIMNPGKIDNPAETGGQIEFGYRPFEGAAAGTIMIGQRPTNLYFDKIFDWPDAVVDMPFGSDQIRGIMRELDRQPDRQVRIRMNNIIHSLRRHDWAYRWEFLLNRAGLEPMPELIERQNQLARLAGSLRAEDIEP